MPYQHMAPPPVQPQFTVVKSYMVESGTYNPMFTRPYTTTLDNNGLNNFMEATHGGTDITRYNIAPIASSLVAPSAQPDAQINIANGWQQTRIIFMMEIAQVGTGISTVISGYADKVDLSLSGILDPHLRLTINSVLTLNTVQQMGPHGVMEMKRVIDNGHLLGAHTAQSVLSLTPQLPGPTGYNPGNRVFMQRPSDIAHNLSLGYYGESVTMDGRTEVFPGRVDKSARANNVASTYIADTVNALINHKSAPAYSAANWSPQDVYSEAASKMAESNVMTNSIMRYIEKNSNINSLGYITWQQINALFPDLDAKTEYFHSTGVPVELSNNQHFTSSHGNFEYWQNTSYEAMFASTVLQTVPSIMSQLMLTGYSGMFTNETLDGSYQVLTSDARSFIDGFDRTQSIKLLEDRIRNELMPGLTNGNLRLITVTLNLSLMRDGYISISIDGGIPIEFSAPCWGDGLYIPTISTNPDSLSLIAGTVSALVNGGQVANYTGE